MNTNILRAMLIMVFGSFSSEVLAGKTINLGGGVVEIGSSITLPLTTLVDGYYYSVSCSMKMSSSNAEDEVYMFVESSSDSDVIWNKFGDVTLDGNHIGYQHANGMLNSGYHTLVIDGVYQQVQKLIIGNRTQSNKSYNVDCLATRQN